MLIMKSASLSMILCLICLIPKTSSCNEGLLLMNLTKKSLRNKNNLEKNHHQQQQKINDSRITELRTWRTTHISHHHSARLRTVHGTVNIIGWGFLFPLGVIISRYFKKRDNDQGYYLHVLSHLAGFLMGTIGWGLGISLKNGARQHGMTTHGILGTLIFAMSIFQLLAMCLKPGEEHECRKYWVIYHNVLGYVLIALIVANIFQGINNQNNAAANRWKWSYCVIFGILAVIALVLELLRWIFSYVLSKQSRL